MPPEPSLERDRILAEPADVERLPAIGPRPWPEGDVLSFSMRGLWSCNATKYGFEHWCASAIDRCIQIEGTHYVRPPDDPTGDVFVPVAFGVALAISTTRPGREAARLIGKAFLDLLPLRGEALAADPIMAGLARTAAIAADRSADPAVMPVRMVAGGLREPTPVEGVAAALSVADRDIGPRRVPTVLIDGLWSCSTSAQDGDRWFSSIVGRHGLRAGEDHVPGVDGERSAGHLDAVAAKLLFGAAGTRDGDPQATAVVEAIRAGLARVATGPNSPAGAPVVEPGDAGQDEPWAEAFDFGRLVPVAEREVGGVVQPTVSARDVHLFLGVGRDFPTWFAVEVQRRQFVEGVDHGVPYFPRSGEVGLKGPAPADYGLTLPAAKKIAMSAPGSRDNAVREYFIECERRFLAGEPPIPGSVASPVAVPPPAAPLVAAPVVATSAALDPLVSIDPLFMGVPAYVDARGVLDAMSASMMADAERAMLSSVLPSASPGNACMSGKVPCFAVAVLDRWWAGARAALLLARFAAVA